jgi:hypothetical protein
VVLLTNFLPPSSLTFMHELRRRLHAFHIYLSTPMEANREWKPNWDDLPVTLQRCVSVRQAWKHPDGFVETHYLHLPYDTLLLLHRHRPDVVISDELGARTMQAAIYAKLYRKKLLIWAHVSESTEKGRSALRGALRRRLLRATDAVIVNGRSGTAYVRSLHQHVRLFEIPRPVDYHVFSPTQLRAYRDRPFSLLYVGRLDRGKGILQFLVLLSDWASSHPAENVRMRVVGHGPLEAEIRALSLSSNLTLAFEAHVPYEQLPSIYSGADALVLPTLADEWGMVVAEALASGLPVLGSTASQAVTELVEDNACGWHFDPLDSMSVTDALDRFFATSPATLEQMGKRGRAVARSVDVGSVALRVVDAIDAVFDRDSSGSTVRTPRKTARGRVRD